MTTERQCRICGGWKSKQKYFSYPPTDKKKYWCKDCCDIYNHMRGNGEDAVPWIRSMQNKWDYILRKVNPDR